MIQYAGRPNAGSVVCVAPGMRAGGRAVVHRQELLGIGDALADGLALDLDDVIVGPKLHVVADAHRRNDDAQIDGDLPADHADAIEQIAALGCIDQPHQAVADFQFHRVQIEQLFDLFRLFLRGFVFFVGGGGAGDFLAASRDSVTPSRPQQVPSTNSGIFGRPVNIISTRRRRR